MALEDGGGKRREPGIVAIAELNVDHGYQRQLSQKLVEEILADYDPVAADEVTVSVRKAPSKRTIAEQNLKGDGTLWCVNGQHVAAATALYERSQGNEELILAMFHYGLTPQDEADLRLKKNHRRPDTALEKFYGEIGTGPKHPAGKRAAAIVALLETFDTYVNRVPNKHSGMNCVAVLQRLYAADETRAASGLAPVLHRTLKFLQEAHGEIKGDAALGAVVEGTYWFQAQHDGEFKWRDFVLRARRSGVEGLLRRAATHKASAGGSAWINYYRAMVEEYNRGRRESGRLVLQTQRYTLHNPHSR